MDFIYNCYGGSSPENNSEGGSSSSNSTSAIAAIAETLEQKSIRTTHDLLPAFRKCLWAVIVEKKLLENPEPNQQKEGPSPIEHNDSISNVGEIKGRGVASSESGSQSGVDDDEEGLRACLLRAFPVEAADRHLLRMLSRAELKLETATKTWIGWVEWRREVGAASITEKEILPYLQSGEAWHHRRIARKAPTTPTPVAAVEMDMDRIESLEGEEARETGLSTTVSATCSSTTSGTAVTFASSVAASGGQFNYDDALQRLHTVVVVGRRHHMGGPGCPDGCGPDMFRKFLIYTVERACLDDDNDDNEQTTAAAPTGRLAPIVNNRVRIVYDRRGMTSDHIDAKMTTAMGITLGDLKRYYGTCVASVIVVSVNSLWYLGYTLARPFMDCFLGAERLIVLNDVKEITAHMPLEELPEGFLDDDGSGSQDSAPALQQQQQQPEDARAPNDRDTS